MSKQKTLFNFFKKLPVNENTQNKTNVIQSINSDKTEVFKSPTPPSKLTEGM